MYSPSWIAKLKGLRLSETDGASRSHLRYEEAGKVAIITYDRPERRNAMNTGTYRALVAAIERANASDDVGAIVLTHTGPVFCAGIDLKAEPEPKDPATGIRPTVATLGMANDTSWIHLLRRSKPTVAAMNGAAIGLGATHVLAADIRVGNRDASFSFPFLTVGTMPEFGFSALLPRIVGFAAAIEICLTAAKLDARASLAKGLLTRLTEADDALPEAVELAAQLAAQPRLQVSLTRQLLFDNVAETDWNLVLTREREAFVTLFRAQRAAKLAKEAASNS
jgi:enoyl-CoA hydratase/carnithine racemase